MKIKIIRIKNFLSYGEEGVEIDFTKYGNIVLIKGQNLDISPQSSNAAGKTSLLEAIIYGFYGKIIKNLPNKEIINKKTKRNLEVEMFLEINGEDYRLLRTRRNATQGTLEFWNLTKSENLSLGGMASTQSNIENLIKLNFESFINVVCFGEHNNHSFLSLKKEDKRTIIENLLALDKYAVYCKKAREIRNKIDNEYKSSLKKYDALESRVGSIEDRIKQLKTKEFQWLNSKKAEIESISNSIRAKREELNSSDDGNAILYYRQCQDKIFAYKDEIVQLEEKRSKISKLIEDEIQPKVDSQLDKKHDLNLKIKDQEHKVSQLKLELRNINDFNEKMMKLENGVKCQVCYGLIDKKNYETVILHNKNKISSIKEQILLEEAKIPDLKNSLISTDNNLVKLRTAKSKGDEQVKSIVNRSSDLRDEIRKLSLVKEPNTNTKELILNEQLNDLETKLASKKEELASGNPYDEIISSTLEERNKVDEEILSVKKEMNDQKELIPYYEFWIKGFGDDENSIRGFIIDDILPALNARINYWLQFLIDNKIHLEFDKEFEPTITRNPPDGDPFVYNATSGGERRRINLAISQAFAHVMMISSGVTPSVIALDEVALNVDLPGVHGIYKMINELSRDRQVLITTHDPNLTDLLDNSDVINLVKKNGITSLLEKCV